MRCYNKEPRHCARLGAGSKGRERSILGGLSADAVREPLSASPAAAAPSDRPFIDVAPANQFLLSAVLLVLVLHVRLDD